MRYVAYVRPSEELAKRIASFRAQHSIQPPSLETHCTLFAAQLDAACQDGLIAALQTRGPEPLVLRTHGVLDYFDEQSLVVRLARTAPLVRLHTALAEQFKNRLHSEETAALAKRCSPCLRGGMYENMISYGSPYVLKFYQPHISLGHVRYEQWKQVQGTRLCEDASWTASEFLLARKDNQGSWSTVACVPLNKSE